MSSFCSYALNTCVDPPHEAQVVSVHFQPQGGQQQDRKLLAMTASTDGKFKIWSLTEEKAVGGEYNSLGIIHI